VRARFVWIVVVALVTSAFSLVGAAPAAAQIICLKCGGGNPPGVAVTPDGQAAPARAANRGGYTATFTVQNLGSDAAAFEIACSGAPNVSCTSVDKGSVSLVGGASTTVTATYAVGSLGTGTLTLTASNGQVSNPGSYSIPVAYQVAVGPDGATSAQRRTNTGSYTESFAIQNTGTLQDTYSLSCGGAAPVTCSGVSVPSVTLAPNAATTVTVTYSVGAVGTGTLNLQAASGTAASDSGSYAVPVASWSVAVTPDGAAAPQRRENTGGYTASFTVQNTGTAQDTYTLTCGGATNVTCGGLTIGGVAATSVTLAGGTSATVVASYGVGAPGTGTLSLTAAGTTAPAGAQASDAGSYSVPVASWMVAVTPDGATTPERLLNAQTYSAAFTVQNTGTTPDTYSLVCRTSTNITCLTSSITSAALDNGASVAVTITYAVRSVGTGNVRLVATGSTAPVGAQATDTGSYVVPVVTYGVAVTPDGAIARQAPATSTSQSFAVQNTGSVSKTFNLTVSCVGALPCTAPATVTVGAGLTGSVTVAYQSGAAGATGTVQLLAVQSDVASVKDSGWVTVSAGTTDASTVDVSAVNPGAVLERDLCLTISAGAGAAYECGDLRLTHALPTTRTLNKARIPTLLYNSAHSHPYPLVAATVTLPGTAMWPDSLVATLRFGTLVKGRGRWMGTDWVAGASRRIVVGYDGLADTTGIYGYTLEVVNWYPGPTSRLTTVSGQLAIVNRQDSPFGAGWWLAGLERLNVGDMRWVGGDGSVRQYQLIVANVWAAPNVDRPDTLKFDGASYVRIAPHGVRVKFDAQGRHVQTINRLAQVTSFGYDGCGRLSTITLPPAAAGRAYQFTYPSATDCTTRLASVTAPPAGAASRVTTLTVAGGRITAIQDPDNTTVGLGYVTGDTNRIGSRTDRRAFVTSFAFAAGKKLSQVNLNMGAGQPAIVTGLLALESRGLTAALDTARAYTRVDGPRTDVADTTAFWLDRFGAPRRIVNALGFETLIKRENTVYPALVTELRAPNGYVMRATYDARGNVATSTAVNPLGDGRTAITRYEWQPTWDFVTKIVPPERDSIVIAYDPANGNRLSQADAEGNTTSFHYGDPHGFGLVTGVRTPLATAPASDPIRDSLTYDALGNLFETVTPFGFHTTFSRDAIGRATLITSPIDSGTPNLLSQQHVYDLMDRDTLSQTFGPTRILSSAIPGETLTVRTAYDLEGNVLQVQRRSSPDSNQIGWIATRWVRDGAGRVVKEIAPDGVADSTAYDPASNVVRTLTRRGHWITADYDPLNRLSRRILPAASYPEEAFDLWSYPLYTNGLMIAADTSRFTYDAVGNVLAADNGDAQVRRSYNLNGTIATDTLRTRTVPPLSAGGNFTTHQYVLKYNYDLDARRVTLTHPGQLAPASNANLTVYAYTPRGLLGSVTDVLGKVFGFGYDAEGRLQTLTQPGGVSEVRSYDAQGQLRVRVEQDPSFVGTDSGFTTAEFHRDSLWYDARAKLTTVAAINWSASYEYSPLGTVVRAYNSKRDFSGFFTFQTFKPDAFGNTHLMDQRLGGTDTRVYHYQGATGRLVSSNSTVNTFSDATAFDSAGNARLLIRDEPGGSYRWHAAHESYYDAAQRLRVVDQRLCAVAFTTCVAGVHSEPMRIQGFFGEYRYDALGRRVWLRERADSSCTNTNCLGAIQRTVWDGDQILYEIRYPGGDNYPNGGPVPPAELERDTGLIVTQNVAAWGRVAYTHGAGIDAPLGVIRIGYTGLWPLFLVVPHTTWRGEYELGTFDRGQARECKNYSDSSTCILYDWPAFTEGLYYNLTNNNLFPPISWMGSLLDSKRDLSGLLYARNRFVDPVTGRFTQEDPLGLAGGLNLYGFAGGDPVNYSDPFGLCSVEDKKAGNCTQANMGSTEIAAGGACNLTCKEEHQWTPGNTSPGLVDPVAIGAGGVAGGIDALLAGSAERSLAGDGAQILANKIKGDLFRDEIAAQFEKGGYQVEKEVVKRTPFGPRRIDIEVSRGGRVLGGIETKAGASRYTPWQMAKDAWLNLTGYIVQLVRGQ